MAVGDSVIKSERPILRCATLKHSVFKGNFENISNVDLQTVLCIVCLQCSSGSYDDGYLPFDSRSDADKPNLTSALLSYGRATDPHL